MDEQTKLFWKQQTLGDLLREVDVRVRDLPPDESSRLDVLSLTKNWGLIPQSERFGKRVATEDISKYKVVRPGWIVYNPYVIWEGAIHALRRSDSGVVSPVYPVFERTADDDGFLDFILRTDALIEAYHRLSSGAVNRRRSIRKNDFLRIEVPVPPLPEQRAIAQVLRTVQRAKEATEKVIAAARQLKQSLMRHLFTYGPVPFPEADQVELKETEIGVLPKHWSIKLFGEIVAITSGQVDPKKMPYLKMLNIGPENIEEATGRILNPKTAEQLRLKSGKYLFGPQDVLYSKIRPYLRKVALPDYKGICSADMYPLQPQNGLLREFLFCWLLSEGFTQQAISYQNRTGIPKINRQQLDSTLMPFPPGGEQAEITSCLISCDRKVNAEENRRKVLDMLFHVLLHHLMTGQIRVHDLDLPALKEVA